MTTKCTIRHVSNDVVKSPRYFDIQINGSPPFTQGQVGDALLTLDGFSSPIQNYSYTMGNPIDLQHSLPNHERLAIHRTKFDRLAEEVEKLKREYKQDQREREQERREREQERAEHEQERREREQERAEHEQERTVREQDKKILLEYEIFDRIAQGLNDYLLSELDSLACEIVVTSKVSYLPLLMTAWWFMSDPAVFTLPDCLQDLPEDVAARFQRPKYKSLIHEGLDGVAGMLWDNYKQYCLVMMACFTHRPPQRTLIAHQRPTIAAARAQIDNSSLFEDTALKNIALGVLTMKGLFTEDVAGI